jgi:F-type H+-transporting ATPase subunit delta
MAIREDTAFEVADVYAGSLLELANESNSAAAVLEEFNDLIAYMGRDADFAGFMESPAVDDDVRRASLEKIFRGRLSDLLLNTLLVLNDRYRSDLIRAVHERYRLRLEEQLGQVEVEVASATELDSSARERLKQTLGKLFAREVILIERVDPDLVGGLLVQCGDRRYDVSVAKRLAGLREALYERASREVHSGKPYFEGVGA